MQVLLMTLLVAVACVYTLYLKPGLGFVDERFYYQLALHLRQLHMYTLDGSTPTAIRPPGYPWVLAAVQSIHQNVIFAKSINLVFWVIAAGLTASLTRRLFGQRAATVSLLFVLGYVVELYTAGTLYPQALTSLLLLLSLWLHFVWRRSGQLAETLLQGAVWTGLILTVPTFLLNFFVYLGWLAWRRRRISAILIPVLIVGIAAAGWSARNARVFHARVFISDNSGEMLYYGNSPLTGANTGPQVPIWLLAPTVTAEPDELVRENGYKQAAVRWIKAHPGKAAVLYVEKTLNWFNFRTNLYTAGKRSMLYDLVIAASYYPLLLLSLAAPILVPENRRIQLVFAMQYLVAGLGYAIFFTRIRYRLPYDYLLIILAAGAFAALLDHFLLGSLQNAKHESDATPRTATGDLA